MLPRSGGPPRPGTRLTSPMRRLNGDPEPGHRLEVPLVQVRPLEPVAALRGQRVEAGAEQGLHLLRGDLVPGGRPSMPAIPEPTQCPGVSPRSA